MSRPLNLKAVLVLLGGCAAAGLCVHLAHGYQVRRNAQDLLAQATLAEDEGHPEQAAEHLALYLGLVPDDAEALARYGALLARLARGPGAKVAALLVLDNALAAAPGRADVRRQAAGLALELGRFSEARAHLGPLLKVNPADADLLAGMGRCEAGAHDFDKALHWFEKAVRRAPTDAGLAEETAGILRERLGRPEEGDQVVEQMVRANSRSLRGRLVAARYYLRAGAWERAHAHVRVALEELGLRDARLLLLAADIALARGKPDEARSLLEEGQKRYPGDARMARALAGLALRAGRHEEALRLLRLSLRALPTRPEELWALADMLIDLGEGSKARPVIRRLREAGAAAAAACLRGRLAMRQQAWGEARKILEQARTAAVRWPELGRYLHCLLAECHGHLGNPDQQLAAYRAALESDPQWIPARRGQATALLALGRAEQAAAEYRKLSAQVPAARAELARSLLLSNQRLPPEGRRWGEIDRLLDTLPEGQKDTFENRLLHAEILSARGKPEEAAGLARSLCERQPRRAEPWLFLVGLAENRGQQEAERLLGEAERKVGPRVEWHLARLRRASGSPGEIRAQLRRSEEALAAFPDGRGDVLLRALAEAALAVGERDKARQLWGQLAARRPGDVRVRFRLFELALQAGAGVEARQLLEDVRRLEGGGALTAYAEAARELSEARRDRGQGLTAVHRHLARAAALRPSWSRVPLLEAEACELEGDRLKALEKYQAALERGEKNPGVLRRVLQLLQEQGRYVEAAALVRRLPERSLAAPDVSRLAAQAELLAHGDRRRALALARQAVARDSKDHGDYLWLGQIASLAGDRVEAEKALRKARDLGGNAPEAWAALILFLARGDTAGAETELASARQKLPPDKLPLVLASSAEALGKLPQAEAHYRALAARPNDALAQRNLAAFYLRTGQQARAEPPLRRLLEPATNAPEETLRWARRMLAVTLAFGQRPRRLREARALLDENRQRGRDDLDDSRVQALLLASQPAQRREALRLLEGPSGRGLALQPNLQFLVAQLHEADGDWPKARSEMLALLTAHGTNPIYLVEYVRALLRHQQADQAAPWLDRLARLGRPALEVLDLRVHVLHATGQSAAAAELIRAYTREKDARLGAAALLLEHVGQTVEAEALYRRQASNASDPRGVFLLVRHLALHGRLAEALDLCERAWQKGPPEAVASVSMAALGAGKASAAQLQRVQGWLEEALRRQPASPGLLLALAQLQEQRGRYTKAVAAYRGVLEQAPGNVVALNNLAFLLALRGNDSEGLRLIQGAIEEAGAEAEFLDTRALVYLAAREAQPALKDLRQAVAQAPSAARYFHLARAHQLAGDRHAARQAYRKATELGLTDTSVHPLEREELRRWAGQMRQ